MTPAYCYCVYWLQKNEVALGWPQYEGEDCYSASYWIFTNRNDFEGDSLREAIDAARSAKEIV